MLAFSLRCLFWNSLCRCFCATFLPDGCKPSIWSQQHTSNAVHLWLNSFTDSFLCHASLIISKLLSILAPLSVPFPTPTRPYPSCLPILRISAYWFSGFQSTLDPKSKFSEACLQAVCPCYTLHGPSRIQKVTMNVFIFMAISVFMSSIRVWSYKGHRW